ncbi:hypothetical protein [Spirosoma litoris]
MENTSRYLHRAAIGYFIASVGLLAFGFPFWFLNAIDKMPKGRFFPPFFYLVDDVSGIWLTNWPQLIGSLGLLIGGISLWQAGEPIGFEKKRRLLVVPIAGAISYLLSIWVILPFAPLGAILNGLGMIVVGVASLKSKIWTDWKRYTPLLIGLFPFVFMFPLRFLTGARPPAMIGLWGFAWLALAVAVWQRSAEVKNVSKLASNS